jgi:hypothetical protein
LSLVVCSVRHGRKFFDHIISVVISLLLHEEVKIRLMDKDGKNILETFQDYDLNKYYVEAQLN